MLSNSIISHSASTSLTLISHAAESDSQEYILDESSYEALINHLNTLTPFEAIRYANEINKMNSFEVVSGVVVKEWKKALYTAISEKSKCEIHKGKNEKSKVDLPKAVSKKRNTHFPKDKKAQMQKGYMNLINQ